MARPPKIRQEVATAIDTSVFTDEELKQLEQEALAEFELESKSEAQEAYKQATKRRLREKAMFAAGKDAEGEDLQTITIDLAPNSPWITIDGRLYYHGVSYKFTRAQAQTINEIMARTWTHEREIGGANMNAEAGRRPFNRRI
ncbi:MAG: hypothetical protein KGL39_11730 [Patescibacteria group bacterium]|nr:hypothetical protein [Patescibacteria group bacterium]